MTAYELGYAAGLKADMKKEAGFLDWLFRARRPMLGRGRAPSPFGLPKPPVWEATTITRQPEQPVPPVPTVPPAPTAAPSQVAQR